MLRKRPRLHSKVELSTVSPKLLLVSHVATSQHGKTSCTTNLGRRTRPWPDAGEVKVHGWPQKPQLTLHAVTDEEGRPIEDSNEFGIRLCIFRAETVQAREGDYQDQSCGDPFSVTSKGNSTTYSGRRAMEQFGETRAAKKDSVPWYWRPAVQCASVCGESAPNWFLRQTSSYLMELFLRQASQLPEKLFFRSLLWLMNRPGSHYLLMSWDHWHYVFEIAKFAQRHFASASGSSPYVVSTQWKDAVSPGKWQITFPRLRQRSLPIMSRDSVVLLTIFACSYPSFNHGWMFRVLRKAGLPVFLQSFSESTIAVEHAGRYDGTLQWMEGVRQGCLVSGFLFTMTFGPIFRWSTMQFLQETFPCQLGYSPLRAPTPMILQWLHLLPSTHADTGPVWESSVWYPPWWVVDTCPDFGEMNITRVASTLVSLTTNLHRTLVFIRVKLYGHLTREPSRLDHNAFSEFDWCQTRN